MVDKMRCQLITLIAANRSIERQPQKQRLSRQQTRGRPPVILSSDRSLIAGRFDRHRAQGDFDLGGFIQQAAFAAAGQGGCRPFLQLRRAAGRRDRHPNRSAAVRERRL